MIIIVLTLAPARLRGDLTRWLMEITPCVYVGKVSARVRDRLWERITDEIGDGKAVMIHPSNNEQGYKIKTYNSEWSTRDYDGLTLMVKPRRIENKEEGRTGWSDAARWRRFLSR
ncbi:type I-E CRISPR-associated endoribonuclease Cas2 [Bifidobacterium rousetti]|uniref:type I-E CRISPR-associated endoribonuclease Cas2e n=1 Tax=Bifidobacterium rousetti TaxID=2045439 RepID=UPI00123C5525|nr:type I-E CRISPR-associated endoribonuclease Cas2e [Bifidobacterium rousetti]KAA8816155.1 type I-E CRISPR-associated endoribonuclease Cas2 [Bifidobacterium rousetti]